MPRLDLGQHRIRSGPIRQNDDGLMAHNHESCNAHYWGATCTSGVVTSTCGYETCDNEYCSDIGHCECLCHSGKTCGCGHTWPRMAKSSTSAPAATSVSAASGAVPDTSMEDVHPSPPFDWTQLLAEQYENQRRRGF